MQNLSMRNGKYHVVLHSTLDQRCLWSRIITNSRKRVWNKSVYPLSGYQFDSCEEAINSIHNYKTMSCSGLFQNNDNDILLVGYFLIYFMILCSIFSRFCFPMFSKLFFSYFFALLVLRRGRGGGYNNDQTTSSDEKRGEWGQLATRMRPKNRMKIVYYSLQSIVG